MGELINIKRRIQLVCPECECEYWLCFQDGWECSECGFSEKDYDEQKEE